MNKIWLITKREYFTRVKNRTFLLSTFLLPLVIVLFLAGFILLAVHGKSRHRIAVIDANGYFKDYLKSDASIEFDFSAGLDSLNYESKGCTAALIIPPLQQNEKTTYRLKYKKQLGPANEEDLRDRINNVITSHMIFEQTHISPATLDSIRSHSATAELETFEDTGKEAKLSSHRIASAIGYVSGLLIYILTFVYGAAVMRGVMEEKTNRIAEVVISSVRPFQLMLGKIAGIGAVGLTQFLLWIILLTGLTAIGQLFIPHDTWMEVQSLQQASAMSGPSVAKAGDAAQLIYELKNGISATNWLLIIFCFLFYFLGGYFFYSSLFAAIGSAVNEDPQEAQSLMLPITMPIVFSFVIMSIAVQDPGGSLAVWASIIPFSAPIVMMARIPFGVPGTVPWWQLGLSMLFLVLGFLSSTWIAGKIYRTGILLYGKKPTWKTLWKWAFRKN
ncbi:MAG: ABC transporter permease [Puia sp.]|nr:ABC transporter permease [Puia sp.]